MITEYALLHELDSIAKDHDLDYYGLPLHDEKDFSRMVEAVNKALEKARKEERDRHKEIVDAFKESIADLWADGWDLLANERREVLLAAGYKIKENE